jgi:hypothetical protein
MKSKNIGVKILIIIVAGLLVLLGGFLGWVKLTRGSGAPYPDLSTAPLYGPQALEIAAELPYPPGNVAVSDQGRIFFNYHYLGSTGDQEGSSVFELVDGEPVPYPSLDFQSQFHSTLGMGIDRQDRLWVIDPATIEDGRQTNLWAFDIDTGETAFAFSFPPGIAAFAQDMQITADGKFLIAADTGLFDFVPAKLIIMDLETQKYWIRLQGHESTGTQNWSIRDPEGQPLQVFGGLIDWQAGVDGIAISPDQDWLYYASINHETLYRVPMAALLDRELPDEEVVKLVEAVGNKPLSDGLSIDRSGRIYITDIENGGIARMDQEGNLETLVKDPRVRWADGISFGPEGFLYFTDSAISAYLTPDAQPPAPEVHETTGPYHIFRFRNDQEGFPGF